MPWLTENLLWEVEVVGRVIVTQLKMNALNFWREAFKESFSSKYSYIAGEYDIPGFYMTVLRNTFHYPMKNSLAILTDSLLRDETSPRLIPGGK